MMKMIQVMVIGLNQMINIETEKVVNKRDMNSFFKKKNKQDW